jgi:hypothetical protein
VSPCSCQADSGVVLAGRKAPPVRIGTVSCVVLGCDVDVRDVTDGGEFLARGAAVDHISDARAAVSPGGPDCCSCFG